MALSGPSGGGGFGSITAALGIGIAAGIAISWAVSMRHMRRGGINAAKSVLQSASSHSAASSASSSTSHAISDIISNFSDHGAAEFKMVILLRTDLEMGKGKIAAQCCHAAVNAYAKLTKTNDGQQILRRWNQHGQPKVVLKVANEEELRDFSERAKRAGLPTTVVADAGRTQIASGTLTVCGIGPAPKALIDKVTGGLKLY